MIDKSREKLIHAIIFFVKNTKKCHMTKVFKLLFSLDFEHFKQTGRSVSGLDYYAWDNDPLPKSLYKEINTSERLDESIEIIKKKFLVFYKRKVSLKPIVNFNKRIFSKRELEIMNNLANKYKDFDSNDMIEESHKENSPWDRVFNQEGKKKDIIPYLYALDNSSNSITKEEALERKNDRDEIIKNFGS
ncbi:MAG: Panacea domain-containing protein [Halobacteriovoraceae bacterium]|nr:Panacea domain-containing protein [Halobacteriovoraceae bacterium]